MHTRNRFRMIVSAVTMLAVAACATVEPPAPPDPVKEQLTILQKQLLELQNVQNETRRKVDEQASALEALGSRVKGLEEKPAAPPAPQPQIESRPTGTIQAVPAKKPAPAKKKPVKKQVKKKKTQPRRQGQ